MAAELMAHNGALDTARSTLEQCLQLCQVLSAPPSRARLVKRLARTAHAAGMAARVSTDQFQQTEDAVSLQLWGLELLLPYITEGETLGVVCKRLQTISKVIMNP